MRWQISQAHFTSINSQVETDCWLQYSKTCKTETTSTGAERWPAAYLLYAGIEIFCSPTSGGTGQY